MNRLKQLIQSNTFGTINESDYPELVKLLTEEIESLEAMVNYYGEQLKDIRISMEFLVDDTVRLNKVRGLN